MRSLVIRRAALGSLAAGLLPVLAGCQSAPQAFPAAGTTDDRQIDWQRSLADALHVAKAEGRPLLIAINMDGESAAERIVRERYRDPAFVALTKRCVCVAASVFRHTPRDHDDQGRRIPCPRLGRVTCGEHMALEPELYDRYLKGTERVAPRHVLVRQDGTIAWDLSLLFDLRDLDRALAKVEEPPPRAAPPPSDGIADLAARRDSLGRLRLEQALARASHEKSLLGPALDAVREHGDAGSVEALRPLIAGWHSSEIEAELLATARALKLEAPLAESSRDRVRSLGPNPGSLEAGDAPRALPWLAELDGSSAATRSLLLACRVSECYGPATRALEIAFGADQAKALEIALREQDPATTLPLLLQTAARVRVAPRDRALPRENPIADTMPEAEALEQKLAELEPKLAQSKDDAKLLAAFAKASLDLARRKLEASQKGANVLLEDAAAYFARALDQDPAHADWWIERARTSYFLGRFAEQAEHGRRALGLAGGKKTPEALLEDGLAVEALRWIGDADARLLAERSGGDPVVEIRGIAEGCKALGLVAASPFGTAKDWVSFGSFCGALGLWREELAILQQGALRLPAAPELRERLNAALWNGGRIDAAPARADVIAHQNEASAEAKWFLGYAWILAAEDARRRERPDEAVAAYGHARDAFTKATAQRADFAKSSTHYVALSWLGTGMAHLLAGRRAEAADCLVKGIAADPSVAGQRDGLDREAIDLVDQALEWTEAGKSPVDPKALLDRLLAVDPDQPAWAIAVADSELREALRADGRNEKRVERETVDAAGTRIRMPMGLPTDEGDAYMLASIEAGRRALELGKSDEARHALAQATTIQAERALERGDLATARRSLADAAPLQAMPAPAADAGERDLRELAGKLREKLGAARPRFRPGR